MASRKLHGLKMFNTGFVVWTLLCFFWSVYWLATGENLPSKWSMPDPRGGPQNAVNVFLWGWVKPDPRGSACPHKEDCVHINITVASGPGTYWPCKGGRFHLMPLRLNTAEVAGKSFEFICIPPQWGKSWTKLEEWGGKLKTYRCKFKASTIPPISVNELKPPST